MVGDNGALDDTVLPCAGNMAEVPDPRDWGFQFL